MEKGNIISIAISVIVLIAVITTYLSLSHEIGNIQPELQAAPQTTIVMSGVGTSTTYVSGGGNCNGAATQIQSEASIVGGAAGNSITATAKCALSNWSAVTTSTDSGGAATYTSATANAGTGRASCTPSYTSAGAPDSAWTIMCSFG